MDNPANPINHALQLTRRRILQMSGVAAAAWSMPRFSAAQSETSPLLKEAITKLEYLTRPERAFILDKGKTGVTKLPPERLREIRLVPETWSLDVVADPASNSVVERPLSKTLGNALSWNGLMQMAEKSAVRFLHVTTCTNGPDPFHMCLWEGVPMREIIQLIGPKDNGRRAMQLSIGRRCFPASPREPMSCAAVPLTATASLNPCRALCPGPATTLSTSFL